MVFEVGDKVFAAHKLLLAAGLMVLQADFFGVAKEKATGYVRICDMHPDVFEALLHYVYTCSLPVTSSGRGAQEEERRRRSWWPRTCSACSWSWTDMASEMCWRSLTPFINCQLSRKMNQY